MCVLAPASRFDDVMIATNRMGMVMSANTETFVSLAVLKAKAGRREDLRAALLALIEPTRAEVGCLDYVLFEQRDEPGTFYMREAFRNRAALDTHIATPHFQAFAAGMEALLAEPLRLIVLDQVSS
ncbi:putative quinol monooxygenase [Bosea sp. ASV33]|uniref:putative quinol monooxygenase n=1 Tax=Bosea sp. ASV33 TaxID=2795106 RepID=UPI0018EC3991|nr:putative quinol monooxygenase [Bosea sp. ASV33]